MEPVEVAADGGLDAGGAEGGGLRGVFVPSGAVVAPRLFEWQDGVVDISVDLREAVGVDFGPDFGDGAAEDGVADDLTDPVGNEAVVSLHAEGVVGLLAVVADKIPNGAGGPAGVRTKVLVEVEASVKAVGVVHDFLKNEVAGHALDVDVALPFGGRLVGVVDGGVEGGEFAGEPSELGVGEVFGGMVAQGETPAVVLGNGDLAVVAVVVDLDKPAAGDEIAIGLAVRLLVDVHSVLVDADGLGEKVEADVIAVEDDFDGAEAGSPCEVHQHSELHADDGVLAGLEQSPVFVFGHAKDSGFLVEFDLVGLFIAAPR